MQSLLLWLRLRTSWSREELLSIATTRVADSCLHEHWVNCDIGDAKVLSIARSKDLLRLCRSCELTTVDLGCMCFACQAFDHNLLVHEIWSMALRNHMALWVYRVPSEDNIADLPSRCSRAVWRHGLIACLLPSRYEFRLLDDINAKWHDPIGPILHFTPC